MTYKNDFKQHLLIDLHKFLIPVIDVGGLFISGLVLLLFDGVVFVMISPFENLQVNIPSHRQSKSGNERRYGPMRQFLPS